MDDQHTPPAPLRATTGFDPLIAALVHALRSIEDRGDSQERIDESSQGDHVPDHEALVA